MANDAHKQALLTWLDEIMRKLDLNPTELARLAGIAPSTITRTMDADWSGRMRLPTIKAIASATGVRPPGDILPQMQPTGLSDVEAEIVPLSEEAADAAMLGRIGEVVGAGNARAPMILRTNSLAGAGLLFGDMLILELNRVPRAGDIVCAQIYDWRAGTAETVARLYEPPYLLTQPLDRRPGKPEVVDGQNVIIKGVFVRIFRNLAA